MLFSFHDFFPFIRDCRLSLLNHHFVQHFAQVVVPVIHKRNVPGEKPVDQGCALICLFFGQHHHNFFVLKKVFVSVQIIKSLFAVDPKDYDGGFHAGPDPADDGDAGINALADLNPGAGQPLLNPLQKKPSPGA
jgi:hypothetical protein